MIIKLWKHLTKRRRKQFLLLLLLMLAASSAEVISVGAVIPFLGAITAPEKIYQYPLMQPAIHFLQIETPGQLLLPLTLIFILAALVAGAVRLILLYVMTRLSFAVGADLSINIYRRTLYQEYSVHVSRNSSEVINGVINKTGGAVDVIQSYLTLGSSAIIIISILSALFAIDALVAIAASTGFGLLYSMVILYTRRQLLENSQCIADQSTQMIKSLQEGLGGIRDVLIDGSQEFYCKLYRRADLPLRRSSGNNIFIYNSPRYAMEAIGMTLIAGIAYSMSLRDDGLITAIPILGALALGAQRLLPALQQAYAAYSSIKGGKASFKDVLDLLDQPLPTDMGELVPEPIAYHRGVGINELSFRYASDTPWILKNVNIELKKGDRIGIMGATGSGKSTLVDIIMGLLTPTKGGLTIDGIPVTATNRRSWQVHIAHVPQNIYLSDGTIEENIAFGISKENIDHERVIKAAKQAQISDLIDGWSDQYSTYVGERGVRLSGGQRQRIGIARALYKQANVLVFDEATSALDYDTEQAVMEAIEGLGRDLTILIIAHRLTTLKGCDQIVELTENGISYRSHDSI